jgi:MtN3 and saliva related transmembrane protein
MISLNDFVETIFSISLFANALFFVPQIIKLIKKKNAAGVSLLTFAGFNVMQLFTAWHGFLVKDYKLMLGFLLSFIACFIVVVLTIYYKIKNTGESL